MTSHDAISPANAEPANVVRSSWILEGPVRVALGAGTFLVVLLLWEGAVRVFGVPEYVIPKPTVALAALIENWKLILYYGWITSVEIVLGFIAGGLAASCSLSQYTAIRS